MLAGDCLEVMERLPAQSVDCVITDPPYGMAYQSNWRVATRQFSAIQQDAAFDAEWTVAWMRACHRLLRPDTHFYAFCSDHHLGEFRTAAGAAGFNVKRTLVWIKDAWTSGDLEGDYGHQTEFIIFGQKGRRALNGARVGNVIEARRVPPQHIRHPTEKPVRVLRPLVQHSTALGEVILDPFAGSGSTGVVAREEGRGYLLIEAEAEYLEIAESRLAQGNLFA